MLRKSHMWKSPHSDLILAHMTHVFRRRSVGGSLEQDGQLAFCSQYRGWVGVNSQEANERERETERECERGGSEHSKWQIQARTLPPSLSVSFSLCLVQSGTGSRAVCDQRVWSTTQHAPLSSGSSGRKWPGVGCDLWVMSEDHWGESPPTTTFRACTHARTHTGHTDTE